MLAELTRIDSGWPFALSLAATVAAQTVLGGRRRKALNEALHELRRPLQALVLALPGDTGSRPPGGDLPAQTAVALERLDREINGSGSYPEHTVTEAESLVAAAFGRCRGRAELTGVTLATGAVEKGVWVRVDGDAVGRALDNLIINALIHGRGPVRVSAARRKERLVLTVADAGRAPTAAGPRRARSLAAFSGRDRHGHGLRVVRRVAAAHGGGFRLRRSRSGTEAVLDLPLDVSGEIA